MKQQFLKGKTGTIRVTMYENDVALIPASATITLYKPGSDTELQASTSATVNSTTGEITYSLTATHTATNDLNYKASWSYVVDGVTYYQEQLFDVVLSMLAIPIIDDDIFTELPTLRKEAYQLTDTATAGAAGSITDTKRKEPDDFWTGGTVDIVAGTGKGQSRDISDYVQSTGVISVSNDWVTNPDSTSVYRLVRAYSATIQHSFEKLQTMIYNKGKRHSLIIESSQIKIPLLYLTVHHICMDLMKEQDDLWNTKATYYWERFNESFGGMALEYDLNEDGNISGEEEQRAVGGFDISRS